MPQRTEMPRKLVESEVFALLAKQPRRSTIEILQESATPIRTRELAERIAERAHGTPTDDDVTRTHLALHHNHLQKLDDADVVTYDEGAGTVRPGPNFDALVRTLERVTESDLPWTDE